MAPGHFLSHPLRILQGFPNPSPLSNSTVREGQLSVRARVLLTRPPTGTPRRAINPSEGLLISHTSI